MGSTEEHQRILGLAILRFSEVFPDGLVFTRSTGKFIKQGFITSLKAAYPDLHKMMGLISAYKQYLISISIPGQADSYIVLPVPFNIGGEIARIPIHIEVEIKSGDAVQSKEQKNWEKACNAADVLYILVRDPEDIVREIKKKWPWL